MLFITKLRKRLRRQMENAMAKNRRKRGKSVKNGNAPSPYLKKNKQPYSYDEAYKQNYLVNGILHRNGKPVSHRDTNILERRTLEAAE